MNDVTTPHRHPPAAYFTEVVPGTDTLRLAAAVVTRGVPAPDARYGGHRLSFEVRMDPLLIFGAVIAVGAGAGAYALTMRDLVRRGRLHRQKERLLLAGQALTLADGRVPCPECAEAVLPQARKCPYCRSTIAGRI
jgi:hypothetical protein